MEIGVPEDRLPRRERRLVVRAIAQSGRTSGQVAELSVGIPANDTPVLSIDPDALELREGGSATIIISASATPVDVIAASLSAPAGGSLSAEDLSPNLPLMIELSPQRPATEIAIAAISDDMAELFESDALALRKLSGFAEVAATLALSIPANDTPTVTASLPDLIAEGDTGTLSIEAQRPPAVDVIIRVRAEGGGRLARSRKRLAHGDDILLAESASRTQAVIGVEEDGRAQLDQRISLSLSAADQPIVLDEDSGDSPSPFPPATPRGSPSPALRRRSWRPTATTTAGPSPSCQGPRRRRTSP